MRPGIGCRIPAGVVEYGSEPPWAHGPNDLFSAYSVGAEMGSFFNEGWPYPSNIICMFAEMMTFHNARLCKTGSKEVPGLLDYCEDDTKDCRRLFWAMLNRGHIDLKRAPIRGAFMARLARVEWNGIPIDSEEHRFSDEYFPAMVPDLMDEANQHYGKQIFAGKTLRPEPTYALIAERDRAMGRAVHLGPL